MNTLADMTKSTLLGASPPGGGAPPKNTCGIMAQQQAQPHYPKPIHPTPPLNPKPSRLSLTTQQQAQHHSPAAGSAPGAGSAAARSMPTASVNPCR